MDEAPDGVTPEEYARRTDAIERVGSVGESLEAKTDRLIALAREEARIAAAEHAAATSAESKFQILAETEKGQRGLASRLASETARKRRRSAAAFVLTVVVAITLHDLHVHRHFQVGGPPLAPIGGFAFPVWPAFLVGGVVAAAVLLWTSRGGDGG